MRRLLFTAVVALATVAAIEGYSLVALRAVNGAWTLQADLAELREARAAGASGGATPEEARQRREETVPRVLHPYLGWVKDPEAPQAPRVIRSHPQARDFGFPENAGPLLREPDPGRLVVAVLGGSVAASLMRSAGPALGEALVASGRFAGREPVVLSLALAGFKQPQQLMALSWLLALGAHFDLVIELDGYNELMVAAENVEMRGVFYAYPKRWYERVADLDAGLRLALGELAYLQGLRGELAERFSAAPLAWSLTAGLAWRLLDRHLESRMARAQEGSAQGERAQAYQVRGPVQEFASTDELLEAAASVWARSSRQMRALAEAHGAEYHHFLQPNQYVEGSKPFGQEERARAMRPDTHRAQIVRSGYPRLQREGARLLEQGVAFHDLTDLYAEISDPIYIDICCHVNRLGNRLLAAEIGRRVGAAAAIRASDSGVGAVSGQP